MCVCDFLNKGINKDGCDEERQEENEREQSEGDMEWKGKFSLEIESVTKKMEKGDIYNILVCRKSKGKRL